MNKTAPALLQVELGWRLLADLSEVIIIVERALAALLEWRSPRTQRSVWRHGDELLARGGE